MPVFLFGYQQSDQLDIGLWYQCWQHHVGLNWSQNKPPAHVVCWMLISFYRVLSCAWSRRNVDSIFKHQKRVQRKGDGYWSFGFWCRSWVAKLPSLSKRLCRSALMQIFHLRIHTGRKPRALFLYFGNLSGYIFSSETLGEHSTSHTNCLGMSA